MGAAKVGCGTHPPEKVRIGGERERENGVRNKGIFTLSPHFFLNYTDLTPLCSANAIAFL